MAKKKRVKKPKKTMSCTIKEHGKGGCAYFLAFLGAAVYYLSTATGFWSGVWGIIKALLWPAFLIHALLRFIGA